MSRELRTIGSFATPVEADAVRALLEATGIRSLLADEATVGMNWLLGNAVHGVKVLVADDDFPRALQLLREADSEHRSDQEEHSRTDWKCPLCGETVSGGFEVCWACGASREGNADPEFESEERGEARANAAVDESAIAPSVAAEALPAATEIHVDDANPYHSPSAPLETTRAAESELDDSYENSEADEIAFRAWKASILGLVFCPPLFQLYSISLLASLALSHQPLTRKASRRCLAAWIVNVAYLGMLAVGILAFAR